MIRIFQDDRIGLGGGMALVRPFHEGEEHDFAARRDTGDVNRVSVDDHCEWRRWSRSGCHYNVGGLSGRDEAAEQKSDREGPDGAR
jgi:hypothetical protein